MSSEDNLRPLIQRRVSRYDGQTVWVDGEPAYEIGNFLGAGVAGSVHEALDLSSHQHVAIKVLNPVGYKLYPATTLQKCTVAVKGKPLTPEIKTGQQPLTFAHVWWLVNPHSRHVIAAYEDTRFGSLRELTLKKCVDIWGWEPPESSEDRYRAGEAVWRRVQVKGRTVNLPRVPRKYLRFLRNRRSILREIASMKALGSHPNVLALHDVLEQLQPTKTTIFLALELASGGELFDRIKVDAGTEEPVARGYFRQLLAGVAFCHTHGVCHRDLKPENLLLEDMEHGPVLKIADFGLSALMRADYQPARGHNQDAKPGELPASPSLNPMMSPGLKRLTSVVGSPHYVAPEVVQGAGTGYDGPKVDAWSVGVILYAMLAGNLPFGKDLLVCPRFHKLRQWQRGRGWPGHEARSAGNSKGEPGSGAGGPRRTLRFGGNTSGESGDDLDDHGYPVWFFPPRFSLPAKHLLSCLLQPDPERRMTVSEALADAWVRGGGDHDDDDDDDDDDADEADEEGVDGAEAEAEEDEDILVVDTPAGEAVIGGLMSPGAMAILAHDPAPPVAPLDVADGGGSEGGSTGSDAAGNHPGQGGAGVGQPVAPPGATSLILPGHQLPPAVPQLRVDSAVSASETGFAQVLPLDGLTPLDTTNANSNAQDQVPPINTPLAEQNQDANAQVPDLQLTPTQPRAVVVTQGEQFAKAKEAATAGAALVWSATSGAGTQVQPEQLAQQPVGGSGSGFGEGAVPTSAEVQQHSRSSDTSPGATAPNTTPLVITPANAPLALDAATQQLHDTETRSGVVPTDVEPADGSTPRAGGIVGPRTLRGSLLDHSPSTFSSGDRTGTPMTLLSFMAASGDASSGVTHGAPAGPSASPPAVPPHIASCVTMAPAAPLLGGGGGGDVGAQTAPAATQQPQEALPTLPAAPRATAAQSTAAVPPVPLGTPGATVSVFKAHTRAAVMSPPRSHMFPSPPLAPAEASADLAAQMRGLNLGSGLGWGQQQQQQQPRRRRLAGDLASPTAARRSGLPCMSGNVPVFHDNVKRSSRFTTTVPATEILARIADVLTLPPRTPPVVTSGFQQFSLGDTATSPVVAAPGGNSSSVAPSEGQHVRVMWHEHRLEVLRGGVCVCTVQVYLVQAGLYLVDFQRGMMDIFAFKRFYGELLQQLREVVKSDYNSCERLSMSALDVASGCGRG